VSKKEKILFRPWKELKQLQNRKLHYFIIRQLYPFSPYYHRLFDKSKIKPDKIRTIEDLKRIPFTSKDDFFDLSKKDLTRRNLDFLLQPRQKLIKRYAPKSELIKFSVLSLLRGKGYLKGYLEKEYRPIFLTATAGTTSQPVSFLYTSYDLENLKVYGKRIIEIFGIKPDGRAINIFPYAPHLAFWQTVFAGISSNVFILSTGGGKTMGTEGNISSILKVKPQFLIGVPSYVYHLLKIAREQNLNLKFLKNIALGATRLPKGFKRKISKLLAEMGASRVRILGTYGFTESRCAWAECPTGIDTSSGYHTYPDKEVFEVIDPDSGEVKAEGQDGELVYSNIDARGTCVLRYRTGDLVKGGIIYSPCPYCGRTVPRISSNISRAFNIKNIQFSKIKGALVNLNDLEHLLDDRGEIDEWQIEIVKKDNDPCEVDELILYVSLTRDLNKEELLEQLNQEIFSCTEVSFNRINFVSHKEIQHRLEIESAVKAKRIVDKRVKA
jgi:phenylacetate-coenzyme A ligase PaaK-like adenylate-forming protein